jgi:hypothetical protein
MASRKAAFAGSKCKRLKSGEGRSVCALSAFWVAEKLMQFFRKSYPKVKTDLERGNS